MREVYHRDQGSCAFVSPETGIRCGSTYFLERDHRQPRGKGGDDGVENLRMLCRTHNQVEAVRLYGEKKMAEYLPGLRVS